MTDTGMHQAGEDPYAHIVPRFVATTSDIVDTLRPERHFFRENAPITGFSIDSRTTRQGEVFVAIPGQRVDGHRFVDDAFARGASAAIVSNMEGIKHIERCLWTSDTVAALGTLAAAHRRSLKVKIIGITGSVGKTTTKEMLHAILSSTWRARKSEGNFNSTIGHPIEVLKLTPEDRWMVAEMGMSTPGEIARLMKISTPDMGMWLSVHAVHQANFDDLDGIARAKAELVQNLRPDRKLVYNLDNPHVHRYAKRYSGKRVTYGMLHPEARFQARLLPQTGWLETRFALLTPADEPYELKIPLPGIFNVQNALAACTAAVAAGFPVSELHNGLRRIKAGAGRSRLHELPGDIFLVDDTYNASPHAMDQVLRSFAPLAAHHYRWLVAGDMLELGPEEAKLHYALGEKLAGYDFDRITLIGSLSEHTREGLKKTLAKRKRHAREHVIEHFASADEAISRLNPYAPEGARIWCKASRSIALEKVARFLREHFAPKKEA